ncbi:M23 family metallopeptidase [Winogradskyella sp.]|uniref:M23 family metallopeptidase n=1 Tax=Winogradskyella sp. TaxID=1883156 RepID=UPI0025E078C5|nr:M23 family metallopeptidase [Winogradskyella sp.]
MKNIINKIVIAMLLITVFGCSTDDLPDAYPSDYLNYETQTELELPFNEEWWVFWGGRTVSQNYHAAYKVQRFALDIVQRVNGSTHSGSGSQNENYYCFGKQLNAPGSGRIVNIVNNIEDNIPGQFNRDFPEGNYVIIDHENGEFSMLAHFKEGSIVVSIGDVVVKGQELGKAGNSGNSSEPHLHYQLQTTANPEDGEGLPAQFLNYYADDVFMDRGEPVKSQFIINDN